MNLVKSISLFVSAVLLAGCASTCPPNGARGPELVTSGHSTETGHYTEVGLEFSTWGDFVALLSPNRWKSPIATGGSLSWLNPAAWSEDAGRTGRILLGEAVVVGGVTAVATGSSGGDGGGNGTDSGDPTTPTPPPGGPPPLL